MRTRSSYTFVTDDYTYPSDLMTYNSSTQQWALTEDGFGSPVSLSSVRNWQFIQDEATKKGNWRYNFCSNVKSELYPAFGTPFGVAQTIEGLSLASSNVSNNTKARRSIPYGLIIDLINQSLSHSVIPKGEALQRNIPQFAQYFGDPRLPHSFQIRDDPFETDFSVWYVLVDLLDFKKIVKSLASSVFSRRVSPPKDLTAKQLHDTHLGVRFGVIPTIKDLQDLVSTIKKWKSKYDEVGTVATSTYSSHANLQKLEETFPELAGYKWFETGQVAMSSPGVIVPFDYLVESVPRASWHAEVKYSFRCPEFQGWINRLSQIVDSFGILDPAALWDVIPFSFVVDWFFSVSSWLHNNRPRLFPAEVVLVDYLESVKFEQILNYTSGSWINVEGPAAPVYSTRGMGFEKCTTYLRRPFRPPDGYVKIAPKPVREASFVSLSKRVAISASLIGQRLPR